MDEIQKIKSLCTKYGIQPSKKWGQNFFVDARIPPRMCEAASVDLNDYVVEVGPGLGTLTVELAQRVKKVLAVEIDPKLAEAAREVTASYRDVQVVEKDILKFSNAQLTDLLGSRQYKVVASLPYYLTSFLLRKFTEYEPRPTLGVFMVQKEVAERVCAKPGEMSLLSVAVQYYGSPEIVAIVPRTAFWPEPEVESAILRIEVSGIRDQVSEVDEKHLFQIVRMGFSSRRKQLQNNLSAGLRVSREKVLAAINQVGLDPKVRAQDLSIKDWVNLAQVLFAQK